MYLNLASRVNLIKQFCYFFSNKHAIFLVSSDEQNMFLEGNGVGVWLNFHASNSAQLLGGKLPIFSAWSYILYRTVFSTKWILCAHTFFILFFLPTNAISIIPSFPDVRTTVCSEAWITSQNLLQQDYLSHIIKK